ncbi:hypothetical protein QQ008_22650 [Fulvivirgaceae bacterium BMA10]|uniref:Uncharacterized protein n=1 Tax=Splendidivirga corallicola TaxID=3051826 RepID=A0ABT8KXS0_9BACT|nr:hypothetical protein [Fulvivirgaceae bacterium BMA10]
MELLKIGITGLEIFESKGMIRCENPLKTTNQFYNESGGHYEHHLNFFITAMKKPTS